MLRHHELKLGTEEADARGVGLLQIGHVDEQAGIDLELDLDAVLGDRRLRLELAVLLLLAGAQAGLVLVGVLDVGLRPDLNLAGLTVDDDGVARLDQRRGVGDLADHRDVERPRHDGDMAGWPALFEHHAAQMPAVIVEQRRRPHRARDQDRVLRQFLARDPIRLADQRTQQPVGEVVEIVQALAQIRIGLAQHLGARVRLHALDRGLGGEAGHHHLAHAPEPALVMREHAEGLEHVAVLAGMGDVAALDQFVDGEPHRRDRRLQPLDLAAGILGDQVGDRDARLMQHGMAEADAVGEGGADAVDGAVEADGRAGLRQRLQAAGGDHLGHDHGRRLQRLDLVLAVDARGAVLHDEHAHHRAAAQDRHAEEGAVDLLARLRAVGEGGVRLRVGERERLGLAGDQADQALAGAHGGEVDRFAVEAFGGVEFERTVFAQDIDRADLGHEVAGDQDDEPVEPLLRTDRRRHHLAETAQQHARSPECASHQESPPPASTAMSAEYPQQT